MAVPPQKLREIVFQLLFGEDLAQPSAVDMQTLLMQELSVSRRTVRECQNKVEEIYHHLPQIDSYIQQTSTSYDFLRIQKVELNILRISIYELLLENKIPPKVAIAEGIRLAKKFGTRESANFVNAVLDRIYKTEMGLPPPEQNDVNLAFEQMVESEKISSETILETKETHDSNSSNPDEHLS